MFEPGHVQLVNPVAALGMPEYNIDIYYEVRRGAKPTEPLVHFRVAGQVSGNVFEEEFEMSHDTAFNFASKVAKVVAKHGVPVNSGPVMGNHKEFDAMFADLRAKLEAAAGG